MIIVVMLVIVGATFLIPSTSVDNKTQPKVMEQDLPVAMEESTNAEENMEAPQMEKYLPFSPEAMQATQNSRRVLFFYANWCPTCSPADASFMQEQAKLPQDVTVLRVNYDDTETYADEKALAEKYQITYQHTFVQIDATGNVVTKWNGGKVDELLVNIK